MTPATSLLGGRTRTQSNRGAGAAAHAGEMAEKGNGA
jgi:hypothetical protein